MSEDQELYTAIYEPSQNMWTCGKCDEVNPGDEYTPDALEDECWSCGARNTLEEPG